MNDTPTETMNAPTADTTPIADNPAVIDDAITSAVTETIATDEAVANGTATTNVADSQQKESDASDVDPEHQQEEILKREPVPQRTINPYTDPDFSEQRALVERGIKAGMALEDIMQIPTQEGAERLISQFEQAKGIKSPKKDSANGGAGSPADEYGSAIQEMENDGDYDPKILKLLKGMHGEITKLRTAGETAGKNGFIERQIGTLDEGVRGHLDAARLSQLRSKYDMLTAGYKATNANIPAEAVFQEAAQLALGDLMANAAEERKAAALSQRKNLTLARPGGEIGQHRGNGPATEEDIASEIWDQIKSN